jgi:hypothetical protein
MPETVTKILLRAKKIQNHVTFKILWLNNTIISTMSHLIIEAACGAKTNKRHEKSCLHESIFGI